MSTDHPLGMSAPIAPEKPKRAPQKPPKADTARLVSRLHAVGPVFWKGRPKPQTRAERREFLALAQKVVSHGNKKTGKHETLESFADAAVLRLEGRMVATEARVQRARRIQERASSRCDDRASRYGHASWQARAADWMCMAVTNSLGYAHAARVKARAALCAALEDDGRPE